MEPNTIAQIGLAFNENSKLVKNALIGLRRQLNRGNIVIAVFGAGGVGKTTLGRMLSTDLATISQPTSYQESRDNETFWLASNPAQNVLIAPGQSRRMEQHAPIIRSELSKAKRACVVVHVAAYGYHALTSGSKIPDVKAFDDYLRRNKEREIEIVKEIATFLRLNETPPVRMITLITKQDLWWTESDAVIAHYESGEYQTAIETIAQAKGTQRFQHEYAYAALCHQNFKQSDGVVIKQTVAGYDDELRIGALTGLFDLMERFTK